MKKLSVLLFGALVFMSCQDKNVIEVTTKNIPDNTTVEVLFKEIGNDLPMTMATGVIVNGKVSLQNPFVDLDEGYLSIKEEGQTEHAIFFLGEPGKITIEYDQNYPDKSIIGGTQNNIDYQKFLDQINPYIQKENEFLNSNGATLISASADVDLDKREKIQKQFDELSQATNKIIADFEQQNNRTALGLVMIYQSLSSKTKQPSDLKEDFDRYPAELKKTKLGMKVQHLVNGTNGDLAVGGKLPDFKGKTPEGNQQTLHTFLEGKKVVLVDIWASWCGPCRVENPNLVKAYQTYHEQGFDIIGYSLDKEAAAWHKAIEVDKLTWTQVSNLMHWDDPIVPIYGIQGIPASYLVDANGTILAMNLKGNELSKKIEEVLKK